MKVSVRYDVRRDFGGKEHETRREYNARFGRTESPEVEVPFPVQHLWEWFWELSAQRWFTDGSPLPLGYKEMQSWAQLTGRILTQDDVLALVRMDDAYLRESAEESRAAMDRQEERRKAQMAGKGRRR